MNDQPRSLLIVDDDAVFRERLARSLRNHGLQVRTAGTVAEGAALAIEDSPEWAVIDLRMPGGTGLELLKELKRIDPSTRVIMLTGYGSIATAVDAVKLGADQYLPKPADADDVLAAFERAERTERADGTDAAPGADPAAPRDGEPIQAPSLARAEWEHIQRVLHDCDGNISEAARRLGIHRRSLQRKLQKYAPR